MARLVIPVGYCTPLSVVPGAAVELHASGPTGGVDVEVVRDGASPEVVWRAGGVTVADAPVPDDAPERGCRWDVTTTIPVGADWRSGLYIVRVDGRASAWFVVRAPEPSGDRVLFVLATNTWNAYNDFGGRNLYTGAVMVS